MRASGSASASSRNTSGWGNRRSPTTWAGSRRRGWFARRGGGGGASTPWIKRPSTDCWRRPPDTSGRSPRRGTLSQARRVIEEVAGRRPPVRTVLRSCGTGFPSLPSNKGAAAGGSDRAPRVERADTRSREPGGRATSGRRKAAVVEKVVEIGRREDEGHGVAGEVVARGGAIFNRRLIQWSPKAHKLTLMESWSLNGREP